jgi:serine/threonine protein phosphatase PrpC
MLSHPGRVRQNNEDACAASPDIHAYVVCDGMGGAAAGEVASHLAAETFLSTLKSQDAAAKPQTRLIAAIQACNQAIYQHASQPISTAWAPLSSACSAFPIMMQRCLPASPRPLSGSSTSVIAAVIFFAKVN